ncbi:hypothetical protein FHR84_001917 [Actinopolyspora biskrensis]|uniref:Uncharacterized protein n=1 Tax=Actinopolyspora biskrensis TaxID=1470178 RepID=A0A852YXZ0_9ACTN|nr:hypothetical protein [Actinopolyspora biskrensis]
MNEQQDTPADQSVTEQTVEETPSEKQSADNTAQNGDNGSEEQGTQKKTKGRKQSSARKTRSVELTLTVSGTAEGEWQADLTHGGKKIVQGLPIAASSVSKAAGELHDDISEAIESLISEARQQHEARLAELEAELQRVRKTLEDLES